LVAAAFRGSIYTSTNGGVTWKQTSAPTNYWTSVASSADGNRLTAAFAGGICTSTNSGETWTQNAAPIGWMFVGSSADGGKLVAVVQEGGIYTSQTTVMPLLHIARSTSNVTLSWIIPSTTFLLQQNADLGTTNWVTVSNVPVLNLTSMQLEVMVPMSSGNNFYRLRTP
jgi:hypothetical protein